MKTSTERNTAAFIHLSIFSQYFFPLGNYLFPIIVWSTKKDQSQFVDQNGKQALNFQLSILIYSLICALIAIPIFIYTVLKNFSFTDFMHHKDIIFESFDFSNNIGILTVGVLALFVLACLKITEFFLIIYATIKASNGEDYSYPLTIPFLK